MTDAGLECDALVVGGGAAGVSAAAALASAGYRVELAEQRAALGGAYHRQPLDAADLRYRPRGVRAWSALMRDLTAAGVTPLCRHVFLGLDQDGLAMLDDRAGRRVVAVRARAIVLAVGAIEKVLPRPGWQMAGVTTAGGLQMLLKETGEVPPGDILIAGSGPLTLALAADLVRVGRPPLVVVEAGDPVARAASALGLAAFPGLLGEAAAHLARLLTSQTRWLRGATVTRIERADGRLVATVTGRRGAVSTLAADLSALHDGIRPNDFGLPAQPGGEPLVVRAGDCREALGIAAASADGRAAAEAVIAALSGAPPSVAPKAIERQRRAQGILKRLFAPVAGREVMAGLPDETIICRCEGRTAGDLRGLLAGADQPGLREIKLNGRFGMGLCQGRFCADNVRAFVAAQRPSNDISTTALSRDRWPLKPVSIASLIADHTPEGQ